jgi:biopolymer transport protein ExbD
MKYTILFAPALFMMISCGQLVSASKQDSMMTLDAPPVFPKNDPGVLKVYVEKNGTIFANGTNVSLVQLDDELKQLKDKNGTVWYSRDNLDDQPSNEAMAAVEAIAKYDLPIQFFVDKTFTKLAALN